MILICSLFRSLRTMRNYIHVNLCISLIVSQLIFVAGIDKTGNTVILTIPAFVSGR